MIDCASIILPITPPVELVATIRISFRLQLLRGDALQAAEQRVGGRVGAGEEHAQPAQVRGEERVQDAGAGERQAEDRIGARVAREEPEAQHLADDEHGDLHPVQRPRNGLLPLRGVQLEHQTATGCAATNTPVPAADSQLMVKRAASGLALSGRHRRHALHQVVQRRHVPHRQRERAAERGPEQRGVELDAGEEVVQRSP